MEKKRCSYKVASLFIEEQKKNYTKYIHKKIPKKPTHIIHTIHIHLSIPIYDPVKNVDSFSDMVFAIFIIQDLIKFYDGWTPSSNFVNAYLILLPVDLWT